MQRRRLAGNHRRAAEAQKNAVCVRRAMRGNHAELEMLLAELEDPQHVIAVGPGPALRRPMARRNLAKHQVAVHREPRGQGGWRPLERRNHPSGPSGRWPDAAAGRQSAGRRPGPPPAGPKGPRSAAASRFPGRPERFASCVLFVRTTRSSITGRSVGRVKRCSTSSPNNFPRIVSVVPRTRAEAFLR